MKLRKEKDKDRIAGIRRANVLAMIMVFAGILSIYYTISDIEVKGVEIFDFISKLILLIFGLVIFFDKNKNLMRSIGFYAIALGLNRCLNSLASVGEESNYMFYIGLGMLALGANLTYSGVSYLRGISRKLTTMRLITLAIVSSYILILILMIYMGSNLIDFIISDKEDFITILMYLFFLMLLFSKEVYKNIPIERVKVDLLDIKSNLYARSISADSESLNILRSGLESGNGWKKIRNAEDFGTEVTVPITVDDEKRFIIAQSWNGKEGIFVTIVDDPDDSFVGCMRFNVLSMDDSKESVVDFIDGKGICMTVTKEAA